MGRGKGPYFLREVELVLRCCVVAFLRCHAIVLLRRCCYFYRPVILSFLVLVSFGVIALECGCPALHLLLCVVALLYCRLVLALRCNRCVIALLRFAVSHCVVMLLRVRTERVEDCVMVPSNRKLPSGVKIQMEDLGITGNIAGYYCFRTSRSARQETKKTIRREFALSGSSARYYS